MSYVIQTDQTVLNHGIWTNLNQLVSTPCESSKSWHGTIFDGAPLDLLPKIIGSLEKVEAHSSSIPTEPMIKGGRVLFSPRAKVQECAQKYSLQWLPACDWPSWRGWHCKWMALTSTCGFIILDATQKTYIYIHTYIHNIYIHIYIFIHNIITKRIRSAFSNHCENLDHQRQDAARAAPKCGLVQFGLAAEWMEAEEKRKKWMPWLTSLLSDAVTRI